MSGDDGAMRLTAWGTSVGYASAVGPAAAMRACQGAASKMSAIAAIRPSRSRKCSAVRWVLPTAGTVWRAGVHAVLQGSIQEAGSSGRTL
ncbi:hypothetical protein RKD49_000199 [Streptomyces glaucescens]